MSLPPEHPSTGSVNTCNTGGEKGASVCHLWVWVLLFLKSEWLQEWWERSPGSPARSEHAPSKNVISKTLTRRFLRPDRPAPGEDAAPKTSSSDLSKHVNEDGVLTVGRLYLNSSRNKTGMQPGNHKSPFWLEKRNPKEKLCIAKITNEMQNKRF